MSAKKFSALTWEHLKKIGIAYNRAKYFITCKSPNLLTKDFTPQQLKQQIISFQRSKYEANFSSQLKIF